MYLLGQFDVQADDLPIKLSSRPAQSLLAYLALNAGVTQRREKLAGLLWPEATESNARSYLRQALWRIRKSFETASVSWEDYLRISDINVVMDNQAEFWLDADRLQQPLEKQSAEDLIQIVELYRGELLPGFYDEWVLVERDRLQSTFHQKINRLIDQLTEAQRWSELIHWAEEWIRLGYSPEPAYRALMRGYAGLGDPGMVSTIYQRCVESLSRELGLDPSPETRELYEQILRGEWEVSPIPVVRSDAVTRLPSFLEVDELQDVEQPVFVAREKELGRLDRFLEQAMDDQGRVVFVTGETGSGKTALIQEFASLAQDSHKDLVIARGNCNAHTGIGDPYLPFREILELLTGDVEARWIAGTISRDHAQRLWSTLPLAVDALLDASPNLIGTLVHGSALRDRASAYAPSGAEWIDRLDKVLDRRAATFPTTGMGQSDLFEQYSRVLCSLSRSVPLVLVVDDLQWADLGSISLLFHLGRSIKRSRILLICAYRPEEVALGRDGDRHPLAPVVNEFLREYGESTVNVDEADSRTLVEDLLDSEPNDLGHAFRKMFYQQTRGNPLFSLELLRGMQDRGDLVQGQDGQWIEGPALDWETLPARVEAVIGERIGRLDKPLRDVLRAASVEGDEFTAEAVAQVLSTDEREMLGRLSRELDKKHRLIRSQSILRVDGQLLSRYRFRHTLFQKYLYGSLDEVERVYLHEQVGKALEELYRSQEETPISADLAPKLAWHFQEARIPDKATYYLLMAGERALLMSAYQEAVDHFTNGLDLLRFLPESPDRDNQEVDLLLNLAIAWQGIEGARDLVARQAYTRAYELCHQKGRATPLSQVLGEMVEYSYVGADYQEARKRGDEALALAEQAGDPVFEAFGHWYKGFINFTLGNFSTSHESLERVISFYKPRLHHQDFVVLRGKDAGLGALAYDACCLWCLGFPDQALERSQESLSLARELAQPFSQIDVLAFGGCVFNGMCRDASALKENAEEIVRLTSKTVPGWRGTGEMYRGEALVMLGQVQEGIEQIRDGIRTRQSVDTVCHATGPLGTLARAEGMIGNASEGLKTMTRALNLVEQTGERCYEPELYRMQGELYAMLGDDDHAEASYENAVEAAQHQSAKSWELRAAISLARLWHEQGRVDEALQMLRGVYDWFLEGFNTPDLLEAKEVLEDLSEERG